jgi:hypothetical protein
MPFDLGAVRLTLSGGCLVIVGNANCCSDGMLLTAPTFSLVKAGPIHCSISCGVTYQKYIAVSLARVPVGTAQTPALGNIVAQAGRVGRDSLT